MPIIALPGTDFSGNNNFWAVGNNSMGTSESSGATYDIMLDTPTDTVDSSGNVIGNYALFNVNTAFQGHNSGGSLAGGPTFTNAGTRVFRTQNDNKAFSTLSMSSGKWYWEFLIEGHTRTSLGINLASIQAISPAAGDEYGSPGMFGLVFEGATQSTFSNRVGASTSYNTVSYTDGNWAVGNTIGIAFDADNGELYFSRNGVWGNSGNPATRTNPLLRNIPQGDYVALWAGGGDYPSSATVQGTINFGQRSFTYTPPTGFKALNTKNLKDVGSYNLPDNFGNFVNTADLVWIKRRNNTSQHVLSDTVSGPDRELFSSSTSAQQAGTGQFVRTFDPNGFTLGPSASGTGDANISGGTYVGWAWNRGKIPGFDIVNYSGSGVAKTVAHNLGQAPKMMFVKKTSGAQAWSVWHAGITAEQYLVLNTTALPATLSTMWNNQAPGNHSFSVGTDGNTNANSSSYIAYLWAEVPGFSKFGSYTGNSSADGPFVYTGFRPKYVMVKKISVGLDSWIIYDSVRNAYNGAQKWIVAHTTDSEYDTSTGRVDFVSNGFKIRTADGGVNTNNFIYMAYAETPFKYANAR